MTRALFLSVRFGGGLGVTGVFVEREERKGREERKEEPSIFFSLTLASFAPFAFFAMTLRAHVCALDLARPS